MNDSELAKLKSIKQNLLDEVDRYKNMAKEYRRVGHEGYAVGSSESAEVLLKYINKLTHEFPELED